MIELTRAMTLILIVLRSGEQHGYSVMTEIEAMTDGAYRVAAGTLYRSIHQMVTNGLLEEAPELFDHLIDDERRRYYRITDQGREALDQELERLEKLLAVGRKHQAQAN